MDGKEKTLHRYGRRYRSTGRLVRQAADPVVRCGSLPIGRFRHFGASGGFRKTRGGLGYVLVATLNPVGSGRNLVNCRLTHFWSGPPSRPIDQHRRRIAVSDSIGSLPRIADRPIVVVRPIMACPHAVAVCVQSLGSDQGPGAIPRSTGRWKAGSVSSESTRFFFVARLESAGFDGARITVHRRPAGRSCGSFDPGGRWRVGLAWPRGTERGLFAAGKDARLSSAEPRSAVLPDRRQRIASPPSPALTFHNRVAQRFGQDHPWPQIVSPIS